MATLQKFKLLATQCGVVQSPTRSPRTSPVVHFRRRKTTLRMLLTRTTSRRSPTRQEIPTSQPSILARLPEEKKKNERDLNGRTLKDLFVSSPPFGEEEEYKREEAVTKFGGKSEQLAVTKLNGLGVEPGSPRPGWVGFRHRQLLRRAWRPILVTIPESE